MPSTEYICRQCNHAFRRVTLKDDEDAQQTCPRCKARNVKPSMKATSLFKGIGNNSALAGDTN